MSAQSDTPRTDAAICHHGGNGVGVVVPVEFARQLERELAALRAASHDDGGMNLSIKDFNTALADTGDYVGHTQIVAASGKVIAEVFDALDEEVELLQEIVRRANAPTALRAVGAGEWCLPSEQLNKPQLESIAKLVQRTKHAHYTNVVVRINGENETYEADWIKHMTLSAAPSPASVQGWAIKGPDERFVAVRLIKLHAEDLLCDGYTCVPVTITERSGG